MKEPVDIFFSNTNTCECGCGQIVKPGKRFINGHCGRGKHHTKQAKKNMSEAAKNRRNFVLEEKNCECGCGQITKPGNMFIHNHHCIGKHHTEKTKKLMSNTAKGRITPEETKKLISDIKKRYFAENPKNSDGYFKNNIPKYDLYASQISYAEQVRRNSEDHKILETRCTYCGKWFIPALSEIQSRIKALNGVRRGTENRLYCSKQCKHECPIYRKQKYSAEEKNHNQLAREVQAELRQMVFERDNWECQKCGSTKSLHCHHVEGIRWDPLESADVDKCITFCKSCHKKVHKIKGCGYHDLMCVSNNIIIILLLQNISY